jgi:hypothetical protein
MAEWTMPKGVNKGELVIESAPDRNCMEKFKDRVEKTLNRHGVLAVVTSEVTNELAIAVSHAYTMRNFGLTSPGPGRRPSAASNVLSVEIFDILKSHGLRGNWMACGDDEEDGIPGLAAELESIAQTAFREAQGHQIGIQARPARISEARKRLGKLHRNS